MARDMEVRIRINPTTGRAVVVQSGTPGGGGGGGGASGGGGGGGDTAADIARQVATQMRGPGAGAEGPGSHQLPWWLGGGLLGQAAGRSVSAALDPHMSGAQQQSIMAREGARAAAYTATKAAATAATGGVGAILGGADANIDRIAEAVGNAVGAAVEKAMERRTQTQAAATSTVQGVASRYAAAGMQDLLSDEDLDRLLARETSRQERIYDVRSRVAQRSGNFAADAVTDVQRAIGEGFDAVAGSLGAGIDRNALDEARRQAEQQYRANLAATGQRS